MAAIAIGSAIKAGARNRASSIGSVGGGAGVGGGGGIGNVGVPGGVPIKPPGVGTSVNVVNIVLQPSLANNGDILLRVVKNAESRNVRVTGRGLLR